MLGINFSLNLNNVKAIIWAFPSIHDMSTGIRYNFSLSTAI